MATHNFHPWTCPHFIGFLINVKDSLSCTNFLDFAEILSPDEKRTARYVVAEKKSPHVHVAEDKQQHQQQQSPAEEQPQIQRDPGSKTDTPRKVSSEISQDSSLVFSSDRSSVTDEYESCKAEEEKPLGAGKESFNEQKHEKLENCSLPSLYHNLLSKSGNKDDQNKTDTPDSSFSTSSSTSSQSSFSKLRSNSTRVSTVFRNLITCGTVDTNDAALIRMKAAHKIVSNEPDSIPENKAQICKGDKLGGSARCFGTSWNHHHQQNQYGAR